jgi:4-hydroxy-3-polyprenylbenzoate decarboxylase
VKIILAITGASGVAIGVRLAEALRKEALSIIVSENAKKVARYEVGDVKILNELKRYGKLYDENEIDAPTASGSSLYDAMVICPCSMKTLSAIANGFSYNLITRSADVMISERRKLILVPRETPLNPIHIENMLKLSKIGVIILPPMLSLYHKPKKVGDVVDFVVGKVLDSLGVENKLYKRWKSV